MKKQGYYYEFYVYLSLGSLPEGENWEGFVYKIYSQTTKELVRESDEWFDSEAQAGFAAIGHISLLENGEG